ncbi:MAG: molybdate ABC transporter substrate-binding protein [Terrimesophilobacter sp.]
MIRHRHSALAAVTVALLLAGCTATAPIAGEPSPTTTTAAALSGDLTIFAAASLTASFNEMAVAFAKDNPSVTVKPIDYDGSSTLATQINEGAPADVFASADQANMDKIKDQLAEGSTIFANNSLQIAVQKGNPKRIAGLADLAKSGIQVVLCAPKVPCGAASQKILGLDAVAVRPVSEEQNVKAVITKVQSGNADAGLVYVTDVKATDGAVDGIDIAGTERASNAYPIAALTGARNPAVAKAFVQWVLSTPGQAVLAKYGFVTP